MNSPASPPASSRSVLVLLYDSFAEFEIAVLLTALAGGPHRVTTCAPVSRVVTSAGGLRVVPDLSVAEVDAAAYDALVVPGGEAAALLGNGDLHRLVVELDRRGALLAAICGGPAVLGDAGVLAGRPFTAALEPRDPAWRGIAGCEGRVAEMLVSDGNVVTATGSNYLAFAEEVLRVLDGKDTAEPLAFFREPSLG